jgi:2-polyprenyl-3-methyl-5-hydroxy-6-metoxy-1,4-benzoquinol methylase
VNGTAETQRPAARGWQQCPLCSGTRHQLLYDFSSSSTPGAVPGRIVCCLDCALQYKIPARPEIPLAHYYANPALYAGRDDLDEAALEFAQVLRVARGCVAPPARLLDVGSGPGHFLRAAVGAGYSVTGIELNVELAHAAATASGAEVLAGDARDLEMLLAGRERSFGIVTLLDLIEHVQEPLALLRAAARFVAPGGALIVYTPNHRGLIARTAHTIRALTLGVVEGPLRGIYDCDHVVFFDPASLREAVRRAGLQAGPMSMVRFNPHRRRIARGISAVALQAIESLSPWLGGEFRMLLVARPG